MKRKGSQKQKTTRNNAWPLSKDRREGKIDNQSHSSLYAPNNLNIILIGERAKRARRYLVMSMESRDIYIYYIPPPLTVHFSMTRSVRYQPILHTLYYTLHTEHAYCLSYRFLNNVVITTVIEMVEMVEILD